MFPNCFPALDTRFHSQVKSVRGLLPECITTRSLLPFGGLSTSSASASPVHLYAIFKAASFFRYTHCAFPTCLYSWFLGCFFTDTHFPRCVFRYAIFHLISRSTTSFKMYAIPLKDLVNEEDGLVRGPCTELAIEQAFRSRFETLGWNQTSLVTSGGDGWFVKMEDRVTVIAPIITGRKCRMPRVAIMQ